MQEKNISSFLFLLFSSLWLLSLSWLIWQIPDNEFGLDSIHQRTTGERVSLLESLSLLNPEEPINTDYCKSLDSYLIFAGGRSGSLELSSIPPKNPSCRLELWSKKQSPKCQTSEACFLLSEYFSRSGQRDLSLSSRRRSEELHIFYPDELRSQFLEEITSTRDLELLLPTRFPHLINWLKRLPYLEKRIPGASKIFEEKFVTMLDNLPDPALIHTTESSLKNSILASWKKHSNTSNGQSYLSEELGSKIKKTFDQRNF